MAIGAVMSFAKRKSTWQSIKSPGQTSVPPQFDHRFAYRIRPARGGAHRVVHQLRPDAHGRSNGIKQRVHGPVSAGGALLVPRSPRHNHGSLRGTTTSRGHRKPHQLPGARESGELFFHERDDLVGGYVLLTVADILEPTERPVQVRRGQADSRIL